MGGVGDVTLGQIFSPGRVVSTAFLSLLTFLLFYTLFGDDHSSRIPKPLEPSDKLWEKQMQKLYLTDSECSVYFPHAFDEIEIAKSRGPIGKAPRHDDVHGYVRARIHNGVV
jgi:hypothetical protein